MCGRCFWRHECPDRPRITPGDEGGWVPSQVPMEQEMQPRCFCRRHHRAKTLGLWRKVGTPDASYR